MEKKKTKVIVGFPGIGKTTLFNKGNLSVLDSDSSLFSWKEKGVRNPDFPKNYMDHIKENIGKVDIILISSHQEVRDALVGEKISFTLCYPSKTLKEEYVERYINRGSHPKFIELVSENWDQWIEELEKQKECSRVELTEGQFLADVIGNI